MAFICWLLIHFRLIKRYIKKRKVGIYVLFFFNDFTTEIVVIVMQTPHITMGELVELLMELNVKKTSRGEEVSSRSSEAVTDSQKEAEWEQAMSAPIFPRQERPLADYGSVGYLLQVLECVADECRIAIDPREVELCHVDASVPLYEPHVLCSISLSKPVHQKPQTSCTAATSCVFAHLLETTKTTTTWPLNRSAMS